MRLSEAIRLGAMMMPQSSGYMEPDYSNPTSCCALGGAWLACGFEKVIISRFAVVEEWPWVENVATCPECGRERPAVVIIGWHLGHGFSGMEPCHNIRWTRERIADWVETIEPSVPAKAPHEAAAQIIQEVAP